MFGIVLVLSVWGLWVGNVCGNTGAIYVGVKGK